MAGGGHCRVPEASRCLGNALTMSLATSRRNEIFLNSEHGGQLLPQRENEGVKDLTKRVSGDGVRLAKGLLPTKTPFDYLLLALSEKAA